MWVWIWGFDHASRLPSLCMFIYTLSSFSPPTLKYLALPQYPDECCVVVTEMFSPPDWCDPFVYHLWEWASSGSRMSDCSKANVNTPKEVGCFSITWCRSIRLYHLTLKWCIQIAVMGDGRGAIARFSCPSIGVATLVLLLISLGHGTCKSCCQAFFYWQNEF